MTNKFPFQIAIGVFLLIGIAHLLRLLFNIVVMVGSYNVPMMVSILADVFSFGLAWWLWRAIK